MRSIVQIGDPVLRAVAKEVPAADITSARIREIIADMKRLLATQEYGVAIAAPQIGESLRIFVVAGKSLVLKKRATKKPEGKDDMDDEVVEGLPEADEAYINPVIVKTSRKQIEKHEGCLSVRGKWGMVPRAEKATVSAYNERGEKIERGASGFLAHIFQHEVDHLDGILYVDKATEVYEGDKSEDD